MTTNPTKLQRWLDIIAYLVGRRLPVSADELFRNVPAYAGRWSSDDRTEQESARRMFERDKDELRKLGIPIRTVPYSVADHPDRLEGYIIERRDFYLPYLKLVQEVSGRHRHSDPLRHDEIEVSRDDAPLALEALRRVADVPGFPLRSEARSAFRKLAFDIDPVTHAGSAGAVMFADSAAAGALRHTLRLLSDSLIARKRVRFAYDGIYRGEQTQRDVAGYGLMFQHGQWYLIGHDALRNDVRVFRVGRMSNVLANAASPNTHDYDIPSDFRLDAYAGREPWELGDRDEEPVIARVRFSFPLSLWADRNGYGELERRSTDGAQTRVFTVRQVNPFVRWLLGLEGEAEVLEPASLRAELQRMARDIAAAHGAGR
jgi:proteasome accessory factor B